MPARLGILQWLIVIVAAVAGVAAAQERQRQATGQGQCEIELDNPGEVKRAMQSLTLGQVGGSFEERKKHVRKAVEELTEDPDEIENQLARNFLLGQALAWWAAQPGSAARVRREELGYKTSQDEMIDALAAADSAFSAVEKANPACASQTQPHRWGPYGAAVDEASALIEDGQLEAADSLLRRAILIYRASPYAYYYQGVLAQKRQDHAGARTGFRKAAQLATPQAAAADSNVAAVREQSMFHAGLSAFNQGATLQGAQQAELMREAAESFRAYLAAYPSGANVDAARMGLSRAVTQSGDTASVTALYNEMLADPSKYTDEQLFEAGATAFQTNQKEQAAQLFARGLEQNPYYRPGLFNLANSYFALERFEEMLPVTRKLVEVDPNNPDNWQLLAIAYDGVSKQTSDAKQKKAQLDSANASVEKSNNLPAHVTFSQFDHNDNTHRLAGTVENPTSAQKNFTVKFEFLDRQGNVVAAQDAVVSVPGKGKSDFSVEVTGESVAAFRYAPIT